MNINENATKLQEGQIGVLPTDTLYGIHGLALSKDIVEKIYKLRRRELHKPFIVLLSEINDLSKFGIELNNQEREFLERVWPGKISVILPCKDVKFDYIHRGLESIAFRVPDHNELREILKITGPLVSTSVNPAGDEPAKTIEESKEYFGDTIDFYVDEGKLESEPSTLVKLQDAHPVILRQGAVKI